MRSISCGGTSGTSAANSRKDSISSSGGGSPSRRVNRDGAVQIVKKPPPETREDGAHLVPRQRVRLRHHGPMASGHLIARSRSPHGLLLLLVPPSWLLVSHGDAMEWGRHAVQLAVLAQLACWWLLLLAWDTQPTSNAPD